MQPYLDSAAMDVLEQQYEMVSTNKLPSTALPNNGTIEGDWMIARKSNAREHGQRMVVIPLKYPNGGPVVYQMTYY